jgi:hypothetical protein
MNIDDNVIVGENLATHCRHCNHLLGTANTSPLAHALRRQSPATAAGAGIHADARSFSDRPVVLCQAFCPGCLSLLGTQVTPADETEFRTWRLAR